MFVAILRTFTFAAQQSWRNMWLSVITVFLLVLTTLSISLVIGLNVVGKQLIGAIQDKVEIDMYFYDATTEESILYAQSFLKQMDEVADVRYVSKQQAEKSFIEKHQDDPEILAALESLGDNVFPASVVIRARQIGDYPKILGRFEDSPFQQFVDKADYSDNQAIIQRITETTDQAYRVGLAVSMLFILISVVVIFNTIRIAIYNYREEVAIMKLVGATNAFIRAPFVLEAMLLGAIAAVITIGIFWVLLVVSDPWMGNFFSGYNFSLLGYATDHAVVVIALEIIGTMLLSVISSMIAITRYLKV